MSAPHFFVPHLEPGRTALAEGDSRHALGSLRLRPGDEVSLADGRGTVARGRLVDGRDGVALVEVEAVSRVVRRGTTVSVAFSPPKGDRLSWAIQKLGELGVDEAVLMRTERSVRDVRTGPRQGPSVRWQAVAREAAMQSRQPFVMEVAGGATLEECLPTAGTPAVMLAPEGTRGLTGLLPDEAGRVRLLIGPEGGWTKLEVERATAAGVGLWSLGDPVLRTETAAVVGAALVLARYGRLG